MVERVKLTDSIVAGLSPPEKGARYVYDDAPASRRVAGFGVYVMPKTDRGITRSFFISYVTRAGKQRTQTIGRFGAWDVATAREKAGEIRRLVDDGKDPMGEEHAYREAPTMAGLADDFIEKHAKPKKKPSSTYEDESLIRQWIKPELGKMRVVDVQTADIEALHLKVTKAGTPYRANGVLALLSTMFNCAIKWKMRKDNPTTGVERNAEHSRNRYLTVEELTALVKALSEAQNQEMANILRLLILTGSRLNEVLSMKWDDVHLGQALWVKPHTSTKQKREHRIPISAPALALLTEIRTEVDQSEVRARELESEAARANHPHRRAALQNAADRQRLRAMSPYVFPAFDDDPNKHVNNVTKIWHELGKKVGFRKQVAKVDKATGAVVMGARGKPLTTWTNTLRVHDLRHAYASFLASSGASLPMIGALLGHSGPEVTARYSHLMIDPLREMTERVGAIFNAAVTGKTAEVVKFSTASSK